MVYLPLANILHHKLRSAFSALGIGIAICMLITLSALSRGSLSEVASRWESVDSDLIVYPRGWGENLTTLSGVGLSDRYVGKILDEHGDIVQRAVPVFLWRVKLAGQDHLAAGVDPQDWETLGGRRELLDGRIFDPQDKFARWIEKELLTPVDDDQSDEPMLITKAELSDERHNGMEIVIDERLATAGGFKVGQTISFADHDWRIVGIAPEGVMTRLAMPRRTAQYLFGSGVITKSTLIFVKLKDGVEPGAAARRIKRLGPDVVQLKQYRGMLREKFGIMFVYVDAVNAIALVIAFLFIMITLYTIVLQRMREIAILKSCGASNAFILRQILGESMILTGAGTVLGIALSFGAGWGIEAFRPLLTVTITWEWIALAVLAALAGALLSALYPGWKAARVDMVEVLTLE